MWSCSVTGYKQGNGEEEETQQPEPQQAKPPGPPGWEKSASAVSPPPQLRSRPTSLAEVPFPAHGTGAQGPPLRQHQAGGRDVAGRWVAGVPLVSTRGACSRKSTLSGQRLKPTTTGHNSAGVSLVSPDALPAFGSCLRLGSQEATPQWNPQMADDALASLGNLKCKGKFILCMRTNRSWPFSAYRIITESFYLRKRSSKSSSPSINPTLAPTRVPKNLPTAYLHFINLNVLEVILYGGKM